MTKTIRQGETNRATSADVSIADPRARSGMHIEPAAR
jgi:hypothetical protein